MTVITFAPLAVRAIAQTIRTVTNSPQDYSSAVGSPAMQTSALLPHFLNWCSDSHISVNEELTALANLLATTADRVESADQAASQQATGWN